MNVLFIEPPLPLGGRLAYEPPASRAFSPPWPLLCLWSYLRQRTRHECYFSDARLYAEVETELLSAVQVSKAEAVAVHVAPGSTGEAAAILDIIKRNLPHILTVVWGEYPSQFAGETPDLGRADYALAGDPEPILRDLLEFHNVPRKLVRVPGLLARWMPSGRPAAWLNDLRSLSLPDWSGIHWSAYADGRGQVRVAARLSRGHTRTPADRAHGDYAEPFRVWPMNRLAVCLQKTTAHNINEVFLEDPPGVWTQERLREWCDTLIKERNTQHWSFRMLPTVLPNETIDLLQRSSCGGVEFLYPSSASYAVERFASAPTLRAFRAALYSLEAAGIRTHLRFWLAGPESPPDEARAILRIIRALNYPAAAFEVHPFCPDSPLAMEHPEARDKLNAWLEWLKDPWMHSRPALTWSAADPHAHLAQIVRRIDKAVRFDPRRQLRHLWAHLTGRNWIAHWENRAAEFWTAINVSRDLDRQRSK
jgi:hypothetical protein